MKIEPDQFETYEALILSEQMPDSDFIAIVYENPDFAAWYRERARQRRNGGES